MREYRCEAIYNIYISLNYLLSIINRKFCPNLIIYLFSINKIKSVCIKYFRWAHVFKTLVGYNYDYDCICKYSSYLLRLKINIWKIKVLALKCLFLNLSKRIY